VHKLLAVFLLLVVFLAPTAAEAQGAVTFDDVVVQLWPEFDRPEMLVITQITLSPNTPLPLDLDFRLPAGGTIHTVAVGQTQATVSDKEVVYETRQDGDWTVIAIKGVDATAVRIEYYDRLNIEGSSRHYDYQWPREYATAALTVIFQQPVDATSLVLVPEAVSTSSDSNGLLYYRIEFPALAVGEAETLTADYQKTTNRLSMSLPQVEPESPLGGNAEGRVSFANYLPWLVGGAGVLLIAGGMAFGLSYLRGTGGKAMKRKRHAALRPGKGEPLVVLNCPECGHRLQPGDRFCRACGTSMSNEE
jgi:hypothetical protein